MWSLIHSRCSARDDSQVASRHVKFPSGRTHTHTHTHTKINSTKLTNHKLFEPDNIIQMYKEGVVFFSLACTVY